MPTGTMNDISVWEPQGPVTEAQYYEAPVAPRRSTVYSIANVISSSYLVIQNKNNLVVTIVSVPNYNAGQNRQMPEHT